jgi:hypothetical protein
MWWEKGGFWHAKRQFDAAPTASYGGAMASASEDYTASEWTEQSMLSGLMQQKWLIAGAAALVAALLLLSRRPAPEEEAARRLVRDWRNVDDPTDIRDLLGDNLPTILRPALLTALAEVETIVHRWFRQLEREIHRL